ncbi:MULTISPECIES: head maturation protease, ClpP-related [Lactobacillaceae]|jgi:ATP-dependent Clp protease protease subunit|uniref:ATP-dependent Clp protease proteolytic subunit n=1 Tax=Limosilactobacillus reuteri TaxID=1598 RepID=A0A317GLG2_LIMRT|nr:MULTISPECIES: head maturation protease, ClpP-related [Lactobacillaceae]DAM30626.1 MAG TPA: Putative ATP dependent Clp protease [Caudoviricetes sp.]KAF0514726.1 Clp protease ClpP [Pediococcus acidilactici]MBM6955017.1 Clp protease ClpP [Limosilactobacillus coleohominis]MBU5279543.1 Clp protease ClpP [Ligilactobacillus animalis]MCH5384248.1 Clp protease ClpP [Limosilactobacillus reuteri]
MKRFWNWSGPQNQRVLTISGTIAEDSWVDDEVTPQVFQDELSQGKGPIDLWLNSPGGDCVAASRIYTMLMNYPDDVNVKIDGIAASAASVIAMAGTKVSMAPTAMIMIHNPLTIVGGQKEDLDQAAQMLAETKESIINAYELKTNLPREKISAMMDDETWMNVNKAIELGFADDMLGQNKDITDCYSYSDKQSDLVVLNKLKRTSQNTISVKSLQKRLSLLSH